MYQFLTRQELGTGPAGIYDLTLATTILGFYLMYRGSHEWHLLHPGPPKRRRIPWPLVALYANATMSILIWAGRHSAWVRRKHLAAWTLATLSAGGALVLATVAARKPRPPTPPRRVPYEALALFGGGTAATAALNLELGGVGAGGVPFVIAWMVGGLLVLLVGGFFRGLEKLVRPLGGRLGPPLARVASAWAILTSVVAGLVLGERSLPLLYDFFTNWTALVALVAPLVVALSPLFVAYGLLIIVFLIAAQSSVTGVRARHASAASAL